jgi:hypothetical protein
MLTGDRQSAADADLHQLFDGHVKETARRSGHLGLCSRYWNSENRQEKQNEPDRFSFNFDLT